MRSRGDTDWLPVWWSEGNTVTLNVTPANPIRILLFAAGGAGINSGDCTIHRVVGQYRIRRNDVADLRQAVHLRLRAPVPLSADFGMVEGEGENPPGDADSALLPSIMWHQVQWLRGETIANDREDGSNANVGWSQSHPFWSTLDVRVKRRLHELQGLAFEIGPWGNSSASVPSIGIEWSLWLRALIEWKA